jgi:uncharacterized protein YggE
MLKRIAMVGIALALIMSVGLGSVWLWDQLSSPAAAQSSEVSPAENITVVGQGSVRMSPDIAQISIGMETSADTVGEAVAENEAQMEEILAALLAAGIDEKDIQTMNYSIQLDRYPEQVLRTESSSAESADEPAPVYRVSNMVTVTVRDLESVGDVLDAVIEAGANNIWGISFALDDPTTAQAEARSKAMEDALARAEALAELGGVELGPVMSISEVVGATPVPLAAMSERAVAGAGPISPGELEISYQVQVSYFIER